MPTLATERLTLTPLTAADADSMLVVYADPLMYEFTGGVPPTQDQLRARYQHLAKGWNHDRSHRWCNWIIRMRGADRPVGAMQATVAADLAWAAVAWEVAVSEQGKGLASEAAGAVVRWLLDCGIPEITGSIHPDHAASSAVAARAGLERSDAVDDDGEVIWRLRRPV